MRVFIAFLLGLQASVVAASSERPMNVLVIQTDEHNFRTLGCYRELIV